MIVVEMWSPTQWRTAARAAVAATGFLLLFPFELVLPADLDLFGPSIPHLDKWVHLGLFAVLAPLLGRSFCEARGGRVACRAFLSASVYGLVLEALQRWIPGRHASLEDGVANILGALVGATWLAWALRRRHAAYTRGDAAAEHRADPVERAQRRGSS